MIVEKKERMYNLLIVLFYFFRQAIYYVNSSIGYFLVGNLDAFFILAPIHILNSKRTIKRTTLFFIISTIIYLCIQILLLYPELDVIKSIINVAKIIMCYFVMEYVKENYYKIDFNIICKIFSLLCVMFLIISITLPDSILWRHNDIINKYDLNRLQFLYTEPSELGFHSILILIIYVFMIIEAKNLQKKYMSILFLVPILATLFLARPLGAIGVGTLSILTMCLMDLIFNYSKKKLKIYGICLMILIIIIGVMAYSQNSLYLRIVDTLNKKDQSNNYRIYVSFCVAKQMIQDTFGIGIGFGNAEIESNVAKYESIGLQRAGIVSSYMNIISESGIFGLILVLTIIIALFKKSFEQKSAIKIALSLFVVIYQFIGTHFTNPLCWILYGIILSNMDFRKLLKEGKDTDNIEST